MLDWPRRADNFAARQLGHATTLGIGSLLFGEAASVGRARECVNGRFATLAHRQRSGAENAR